MRKSVLTVVGALSLMFSLAALQAPPASAAVTISASASASTVSEGSAVRISGTASGAKLGSVVNLQRWYDGAWHRVASTKLVDTRRFSFRITPPRGVQRYRVRKPAQLGQAAATSPTVSITVTWRPKVTATTSAFLRSDRLWITRVTGVAPAYATVNVQHWDQATSRWITTGPGAVADSAGRYRVDVERRPNGWRFRMVSSPSGPRLSGYSTTLSAIQRPVPLAMNQETQIGALVADPATGDASLALPATAGDLVSVAITAESIVSTVNVELNGTPIATLEPYQQRVSTFRAPSTGTYRLTSHIYNTGVSGAVTIWTSTAKTKAFDEFCCDADQDRPGQIVDFTVPVSADDMFTLTVPEYEQWPFPYRSFLDPDGISLEPLYSMRTAYGNARVFRLPKSGTHTLRYVPHELDPMTVRDYLNPIATTDATLDGDPVLGGPRTSSGAGRFRLRVPAGTTFIINSRVSGQFLTPSGDVVEVGAGETCFENAVGGQYDLIVWTFDTVSFSARTARRCPNN
ncbi:hypothetical protein [Nocardioides luteus]|uniref:Bacterial Ig domain-containing protein n=1 Tax=Nocardioides luteus TaxID=1844 RepID=A0A1J4MYQ1_9ACTN|nr:hypothetical protein [Nocardioides luteus]OIJ24394.1 hypothetical protein UG56_023200 [Nocardioides luteus]